MLAIMSVYKRLAIEEALKKPRRSVYRFEKTPEWTQLKADMDRGLQPNEALQLAFMAEDREKYKIRCRRTLSRFVRAYVKANALPYVVQSFTRDGADFIIVKLAAATTRKTA